jgi:predicted ester cyclase
MSIEENNEAVVGRCTSFWGKDLDLGIVDELAAPDKRCTARCTSRRFRAFMAGFRRAFPDLNFWGAPDLSAEGDLVVGRWEGSGTHTGAALDDFLVGALLAATGRTMRFTGHDGLASQRRKDY